jgi:tetratricopeptide (TPR) repeat protein
MIRPQGGAAGRRLGAAFVLAGLVSLAGHAAHAQSEEPSEAEPLSPAEQEARTLFEAGVLAYEAGRYDEAMSHFQRSFELSGRVALLYNIATAAERARQDEVALRAYEQYLERVPDAENRPRVETRITALRALVAEPESAPAASAVEAPVGASAGSSDAGPAPWIVLAGGAAVVIAGAVLLGVGLADQATVENPPPGASWEDSAAAYDRGPAVLTSGVVLLPVGVALAAVGLVWGIAGASGGSGDVSVRVGPSSVQVEGRF